MFRGFNFKHENELLSISICAAADECREVVGVVKSIVNTSDTFDITGAGIQRSIGFIIFRYCVNADIKNFSCCFNIRIFF